MRLWDYLAEGRQEMREFGRSTAIAIAIAAFIVAVVRWL